MRSTSDLAHAREDAAASLEAAIDALGVAYQHYLRDTQALAARVGEQLEWQLQIPIALHLVHAGLAAFLERKSLTGRLAPLRELAERHHQRLSLGSPRV